MEKVITSAAAIACGHKGTVTPVASSVSAVLTVDGVGVLVDSLVGSVVAGCLQIPPPESNQPCQKVGKQSDGLSKVLSVNGLPVLLRTSEGTTGGVPQPSPTFTWSVTTERQSVLVTD